MNCSICLLPVDETEPHIQIHFNTMVLHPRDDEYEVFDSDLMAIMHKACGDLVGAGQELGASRAE